MDDTAIQAISNLAVDAARANRINPGEFPPYPNGIQAVLVGDKVVSLEHLQHNRSRFRGQFATTAIHEFVGYVKRHAGTSESPEAQGFIDAKKCKAEVFFNLGKPECPGHGDWTALLALEPTAAYAALRKIDSQPMTQAQMVEFVEDWSDLISAQYGSDSEPVHVKQALPALRALTLKATSESTHTDKDFGASRSQLEEIEAKSKGSELPTHLIFRCDPYVGFGHRDFRLRVAIRTGDKPMIVLRIVAKEAIEEDIAAEFKRLLLTDLDANVPMTIGSFSP